ncbi:MAG: ABC transporter permease [Chloroflexi bacterium]|nr:MAG: ABC transporter permease [Chloroflexota bacterium]TMC32571.1 MAG: ABC transporter permease [Chloroflexota bacterium]TMC58081.1 MAG: ABC transporter permease [Chloroflexota bacterium]
MGRYVVRRLLQAVPLLLAISVAAFAIIKAQPGGPLAAYEGNPDFTEADRLRLEHAFGLDQPLPLQYLNWLGSFLRLDWGYSFASHQPVLMLIGERLPNTLYLMGTVFVVVLLVAIPVGVLTAVKQYSWFDHIVTGTIFTFLSTPTFWLGLLLIIVFGLQLRWLPLGGMQTLGASFDVGDRLRHLILPVATIALVQMGSHVRFLRASMLETIGQDYMRTARAKGLAERIVIMRHALKNAAIPLVTIIALDMPELFVGALVTEQIFGWPGMGRLFWDAATRSDYPVLQGILAVSSSLIVLANLFADVMYGWLDPRIRFS